VPTAAFLRNEQVGCSPTIEKRRKDAVVTQIAIEDSTGYLSKNQLKTRPQSKQSPIIFYVGNYIEAANEVRLSSFAEG
jgi:hypothetical protein